MLEENYMRLAIQLAKETKQQTSPNPSVGAVIVKEGRIVGFGAHIKRGEAHAEVHAIQMAGKDAQDATLYVTLEPCCHYGKTPPCTEFIIESGIKRVVIACQDVHELVAGKGISRLREAQIDVSVGFLQEEAKPLYEQFFHYVTKGRPFVTLKAAMSLDGKTATESYESKWITNEAARQDAQQYRHTHDAILVGVNTVIADNPRLTTRLRGGKNPIRVILDSTLRTPLDANVIQDGATETWIFTNNSVSDTLIKSYTKHPLVRVFKMETNDVNVKDVLTKLYEEEIMSLYVEGGATVNNSFLREKVIDQFIVYIAPMLIGGKRAPGIFNGLGIERLADALTLSLNEVTTIDGQIKIVAKRK